MKKRLVVVMGGVGREGGVYKRAARGILVVMEMFCTLTGGGGSKT